ncbi:MAG: hypothetical protein J2P37_31785, partial [Ktedonobacteraceae bacterium]|nr:hypothetical protein [Ktedonobacteraceae bacterium]
MRKGFQFVLLVCGIVALVALLTDIGLSLAATTHGATPAKVVRVQAGPYPLTVSLYKDPANAGYALPFAISSTQPLTYDVTTDPDGSIPATMVRASLSPDPASNKTVQGTAEITVQGQWLLHIEASGPQGQGTADVPLTAVAPPAIPEWLGWLIAGLPIVALLLFLSTQRARRTHIAT